MPLWHKIWQHVSLCVHSHVESALNKLKGRIKYLLHYKTLYDDILPLWHITRDIGMIMKSFCLGVFFQYSLVFLPLLIRECLLSLNCMLFSHFLVYKWLQSVTYCTVSAIRPVVYSYGRLKSFAKCLKACMKVIFGTSAQTYICVSFINCYLISYADMLIEIHMALIYV